MLINRFLSPSTIFISSSLALLIFAGGCEGWPRVAEPESPEPFTLAMIPDTQNYVDYTHQKSAGFAIDAADLFIAQLEWVAARGRKNGGDIAFVASVGDTWQHSTKEIDPAHAALGIEPVENEFFGEHFAPKPETNTFEIPTAIEGYLRIAEAGIPFGVATGNHDYDAAFFVDEKKYPPNPNAIPASIAAVIPVDKIGVLHAGGLEGFLSAFGATSTLLRDKPWYVSAYSGGTSSAQTFTAGGYTFLHIALEMQAGDAALDWARSVISDHPGHPTIVSTHEFLSPNSERVVGLDLSLVDPENHNNVEKLWEELIAQEDQIFLVLCGHHAGQGLRIDPNVLGHSVYQVLADYQDRGQSGIDAGQPLGGGLGGRGPTGIGDGWLRLLTFETASDPPTVDIRTYSTHYEQFSSELPEYADWYRSHEQRDMTDEEFLAAEDYHLVLDDFRERFGPPRR